MDRLLKERDGGYYTKKTVTEQDPGKLKALSNTTRWKIVKSVAEKPKYPAQIADELGISEQNIYYHIKQLRDSSILKKISQEERGGSLAKYYALNAPAYTLDVPGTDETPADLPMQQTDSSSRFLSPFIRNGKINCTVVVGSPDPHGPHQVRGRDGHYAVDLAAYLGRHGTADTNITALDVEVRNEEAYSDNLLLVGGPLTNTLTAEFNPYLPVRFEQENFPYRHLVSDQTGNEYKEENIGLIAKTRNPKDQNKFIIVIAGIRNQATRAAVMGLTQHPEKILGDYEGEETWARVVQGLDMDGDGKIDEIEIVE